ncbi:hypothetical protein J6590_062990 [Homalodisca vitripennis]|nr:hypothetical protein J6590_062990 [Homalodisca vitripennis]
MFRALACNSSLKWNASVTLVNGEVSWKCLAKDCSESVRTNSDHTEVLSRKNTHIPESTQ